MVAKVRGVYIKTDVPTKEIIIAFNNTKDLGNKFIIQDLDDTCLLIDGAYLDEIQREVKRYHKEITYTRPLEGVGAREEEEDGGGAGAGSKRKRPAGKK